ncbi:putative Sulfite:cytochrome C oxidoreductase, subunit B [Nitrospina gracilis 3/211]|uniref:Putative Sulfite:cytochrome C oxidoreductase, subunit B n=1 Tax=Nitrospina gracilis (strain 3/211) TaxID=1266370 RepID=M1YVY7_NITG3|nr:MULTISPECIES: hypothetical protein [Nitrospina]MCF8722686.1 hypothetical protein [Nitrospina sp. Nb-3]CCQ89628.1 putative Sulfite:cytochrome C oxidoreductase, subunit B [Nitrospina gracilis 3/211]
MKPPLPVLRTLLVFVFAVLAAPPIWAEEIDPNAGLPQGEGRDAVMDNCTACHNAALILQNRMSRSEWDALITWMQDKQGLWELEPDVRKTILDYLARYRGPTATAPGGEGGPHTNPMYEFHYPPNPL